MEKYIRSCKSEFWGKVFQAETEYILDHLKDSKDILSVGCGPAIIEKKLAEHGFKITCLDISNEALDQVPDSVRTIICPAEKMAIANCSFNAIIYVASLQFIEDYRKAIQETARVLESGGKLLVMLLNPQSEFFKEKTKNPDSYVNKIKHKDLKEIENIITDYFSVQTEYFLGIKETEIFQSRDSNLASLYIIKGVKK